MKLRRICYANGFVEPYFSHFVFVTRVKNSREFFTACEKFERIRHRFRTHLSHMCDIAFHIDFICSMNAEFFTLLEIPIQKVAFFDIRIIRMYVIKFL